MLICDGKLETGLLINNSFLELFFLLLTDVLIIIFSFLLDNEPSDIVEAMLLIANWGGHSSVCALREKVEVLNLSEVI